MHRPQSGDQDNSHRHSMGQILQAGQDRATWLSPSFLNWKHQPATPPADAFPKHGPQLLCSD